jgi:hypothetical protein
MVPAREYVAGFATLRTYHAFAGDSEFAEVCQTETAAGAVDVMRI